MRVSRLPVRRSRGYAPRPIALPVECGRPILAVGGQLKVTFALGRGRQAFLSHHMGDLDYYEAYCAFVRDVSLYENLFGVRPECIVHDLHPDYVTTRYARALGERERISVLGVQHHHAHMASCMAEHGLTEPAIGVSFDGTGYGTDGAIWGGEFLVGDYVGYQRTAHLSYVAMPGGEQAIREPVAVYATTSSGGNFNVRVALRQRVPGEARNAIAACLSAERVVSVESAGFPFSTTRSSTIPLRPVESGTL